MAQTCTICRHKQREAIERAMLQATPVRHIASRYRLSTAAIQRHRKSHLPGELRIAHEASRLSRGQSLLDGIRVAHERADFLYQTAETILRTGLEQGDHKTVLKAVHEAVGVMSEARQYLELKGQVTGELGQAAAPIEIQRAVIVMPRSADLAGRRPLGEEGHLLD